jgi:hypothetical protein
LNYQRKSEHELANSVFRKAYEDVTHLLGRDWWHREELMRRRALENILLNLQVCVEHEDGWDEVSVSRTRGNYRTDSRYRACHFKFQIYVDLMDALIESGWCTWDRGFYDRRPGGKSRLTRLYPTTKIFIPGQLSFTDTYVDARELIELRAFQSKEPLPYEDTRYTRRCRRQLERYNAFMSEQEIVYYQLPENKVQLFVDPHTQRVVSNSLAMKKIEREINGGEKCVEIEKVIVHYSADKAASTRKTIGSPAARRIFNQSLSLGGRHYTSYQTVPQIERACMLFGDEPSVELDFKSLHPTLLYHRENENPPDDCYHVFGDCRDEIARPLVKLILLIVFNVNGQTMEKKIANAKWAVMVKFRNEKWRRKIGIMPLPVILDQCSVTLDGLLTLVMFTHRPIQKYFFSGCGLKLQKQDSEIMRDILNKCTWREIPAMPIHDSVIVPARFTEELEYIMSGAYHRSTGKTIRIEAKEKPSVLAPQNAQVAV